MKTLKTKDGRVGRHIADYLRSMGVKCRLVGSHGGEGMQDQGALVNGVSMPDRVYDAYVAYAADRSPANLSALEAACKPR